jgi:uncharacterized protein (DUF1697 family)
MTTTFIALLRGVNVGDKNKLPMKDLAAMFVAAGCADARTYIQSGNVLFQADSRLAARLPDLIAARIAEDFGYRTPVILRTADELAAVVAGNPFVLSGADLDALHVLFLADAPSQSRIDGLDAQRSPPDTFLVRGREIFLSCPSGLARTKLTNTYFDAKLATTSTGRNWRTVTKLLELTGRPAGAS